MTDLITPPAQQIITAPGIYKGLPNEVYHDSQGVSNSGLGLLLPPNCPKLYWYQKLSGKYVRPEAKDKKIGSALHTLTLEPDTFNDRFIYEDFEPIHVDELTQLNVLQAKLGKEAGKFEYDMLKAKVETQKLRRKKRDAEFLERCAGKEVLSRKEYDIVSTMAESVRSHAIWKEMIGDKKGCVEDSIAWTDPETGVLLRTRPDYYNDELIVDVKTSKDNSPWAFARSVLEYGYHRQGAMACDGLTNLYGRVYDDVLLFVVSKTAPYFVRCYVIDAASLERGRVEYKQGAMIYKQAVESGVWESYPEIIEDISLPKYAFRSFEDE